MTELIGTTTTAAAGMTPRGRRRFSMLTRRDRLVLTLMVAVPTLIQLFLIWIPTVLSVFLSFAKWNGLGLESIKPAGLDNYIYVFRDYPPFWPALQHNVLWLLFLALIATPIGLLLAILLDQQLRGSRVYQSILPDGRVATVVVRLGDDAMKD